jgi:protein-S-isoprenylcysteine O-methyltransferase Ste14
MIAFLAMPGVVVYALPLAWAFRHGYKVVAPLGLLLCGLATMGLMTCATEFLITGKGTLAPWKPPRLLVTTGPYKWSRNPMYLFVCVILTGWGVAFGSRVLICYALAMAAIFHIRIICVEEAWLSRTFPEQWIVYRQSVPCWF